MLRQEDGGEVLVRPLAVARRDATARAGESEPLTRPAACKLCSRDQRPPAASLAFAHVRRVSTRAAAGAREGGCSAERRGNGAAGRRREEPVKRGLEGRALRPPAAENGAERRGRKEPTPPRGGGSQVGRAGRSGSGRRPTPLPPGAPSQYLPPTHTQIGAVISSAAHPCSSNPSL